MNIKIRLKQYLDSKGISDYRFQKDIGVTNGYLTKGDTIRSDYLEKILVKYEDLDLQWLLTGEGSMIKEGITPNNVVNESSVKYTQEKKADNWLQEKIDNLMDDNSRNSRSIEKMVDTADRNSRMLEKMIEMLGEKGVNVTDSIEIQKGAPDSIVKDKVKLTDK